VILSDQYPNTNMADTLDALTGARYFTTIDLCDSYGTKKLFCNIPKAYGQHLQGTII